MPLLKQWGRCCNPLNIGKHGNSVGLRRASRRLCTKWSLTTGQKWCATCRIRLEDTEPNATNKAECLRVKHLHDEHLPSIDETRSADYDNDDFVIGSTDPGPFREDFSQEFEIDNTSQTKIGEEIDPSVVYDNPNSSQQLTSQVSASSSDLSEPVKSLSQLSIGTRLPLMNDALLLLGESPIPRKKLKMDSWVRNKVEKMSTTLKRSLDSSELETSAEIDSRDLHDIIDRLKAKLHLETTSRDEKIQILTVLPSYWSPEKVCRIMDVTRRMAVTATVLLDTKGVLSMPNKKTGRGISEETKTRVLQFYNDDRVSVNMPGMKDYVSVRNENNERIHVQKRLILSNLKELFELFRSEFEDTVIGFSMFASLRPKHCVLAGGSGTHTVCVCSIHQNVKLMMIGSNLNVLSKESRPLNHYSDCLEMIICPNSSVDCYLGDCTNCPGIEILREYLKNLLEENEIDSVTYRHWLSKPRTSLEMAVKDNSEFVDEFCQKITTLLPHSFVAKEQSTFLKSVKESLRNDEFLVICDFAENDAFVVQEAAPGFHWNNNQATIYPVIIYFNSEGVIVHRSLVIISDGLSHDSIAVYVYSKIIIDFIKSISGRASKIYYFSDGAPQQFKNFKNILNLYYYKNDYGINAEWHYFATAHSKGPCDGVGGSVKRMAARASLQLPPDRQITTAQELFEWASQPANLPNIVVKFSPKSHYDEAKNILEKRYEIGKAIPGTQKIHCVIPEANGIVMVKTFSAYGQHRLHKILKNK